MITIYSLFPNALNLNGDAANALVISKRLRWLGVDHELVEVNTSVDLELATVALKSSGSEVFFSIGHGSIAAIKSLESLQDAISRFLVLAVATGVPGIIVGSSLGFVDRRMGRRAQRVSEFTTVSIELEQWPQQALGYQNSDLEAEVLRLDGAVVHTLLHGPFFAKNPLWADAIVQRLGVTATNAPQIIEVDKLVDEIWKLEAN